MNSSEEKKNRVYRLVLTGGPCSGKTTGQVRLSTFFENLGWKVYRVPETATTLFSGGIRFPELSDEEKETFQENLMKTMLSIESTFFALGNSCKQNCLIVCDRGIMDATAYMPKDAVKKVLKANNWNPIELRDNRYNQIVHLVTCAKGAEQFYNVEDNPCRTEGLDLARKLDTATAEAWIGHPYVDVIDNSTDFETKLTRMIACVCSRMGIDTSDRLALNSTKHKFLVSELPPDSMFPSFQDFDVVHDYLVTSNRKIQSRLRKRGQNGMNFAFYQHTIRRTEAGNQVVELRRRISHRDYIVCILSYFMDMNCSLLKHYLTQRDDAHYTVYKIRRCFLWEHIYFQMDIYKSPCHSRCNGLILLEMYTTRSSSDLIKLLPPFLKIVKEVTGNPSYSMYNLSLKAEWNSQNFEIAVKIHESKQNNVNSNHET